MLTIDRRPRSLAVCSVCQTPIPVRRYYTASVCGPACFAEDAVRSTPRRPHGDRYEYTPAQVRHCLEYWYMLQGGRLPPLDPQKDRLPDVARTHPAFAPRAPGGAVAELRADLDRAIAQLPDDLRAVVLAYAREQDITRTARVVHRRRQDVRDDVGEAVLQIVDLLNGDR